MEALRTVLKRGKIFSFSSKSINQFRYSIRGQLKDAKNGETIISFILSRFERS